MRLEHRCTDEENLTNAMRDDEMVTAYMREPMATRKSIVHNHTIQRFICAVLIFFANNQHQKARAELNCTVVVLSVRNIHGMVVPNTLGTPTGTPIGTPACTLTCVISESSLDVNGTDSHGRKTGFITSQRSEFGSPRYRGLDAIIHNLIQ